MMKSYSTNRNSRQFSAQGLVTISLVAIFCITGNKKQFHVNSFAPNVASTSKFGGRLRQHDQQREKATTPSFVPRSVLSSNFRLGVSTTSSEALQSEEYEEYLEEVLKAEQEEDIFRKAELPGAFFELPPHSLPSVNAILRKTESIIHRLHETTLQQQQLTAPSSSAARNTIIDTSGGRGVQFSKTPHVEAAKKAGLDHEQIYANSYVDMGKIEVIGFDFDYTLVTYKEELLELIYEKALMRLVSDRQYPAEMLLCGMKFDPFFSIRGLAVDKDNGWITHLSYTHKVAVAWEGREKVQTSRIFEEYQGKRALRPSERRKRLKPLNDLFSMAECCLIADTIQFFKERSIPYCAQNVVNDVLKAVTDTHLSGDFHRIVANHPERYFDPTPHLKQVLQNLKASGKRLIFVSNSPFWYVDAGMRYVLGINWRDVWDAVVTNAGKPNFYTDEARPFREICQETRRLMFKRVDRFEKGKVYTEGCLRELMRLLKWKPKSISALPPLAPGGSEIVSGYKNDDLNGGSANGASSKTGRQLNMGTANVLYIGDSLFADLVDAKREFGWTTAAVTPEVGYEMEIQKNADFALAAKIIDLLLNALRLMQDELGNSMRTEEDIKVLDGVERLVSLWRDRETYLLGSPFGSIFRARYQPSLFAHSLRRYCDLYMTSVSSLRHYSPQHRFYPEQNHRLLAHEIKASPVNWSFDELMDDDELII